MVMRAIDGTVVRGHRVASGMGDDARFPEGTIALQLPWLRRMVPDLDLYLGGPAFPGTINLAIGGTVAIGVPEVRLDGIAWTPHFPPENFFLSRAVLEHRGVCHPVFLYLPDPATKPDHAQPPDRIELLGARIAGLAYGDWARLDYKSDALRIAPAPARHSPAPRKAGNDAVTSAR